MTENAEKTLVKKLAKIMGKIGVVPKTGFNNFHKYNYTTEADVQAITSNRMAEENLIMIVIEVENETRQVTTKNGKTEFIYRGTFDFQIHDGDSGEVLTMRVSGEGQDAGDKAAYKALTGAHKYALMKLFQISTGDDPERQEEPPRQNNYSNNNNHQQDSEAENERKLIQEIMKYKNFLANNGKNINELNAHIAKKEGVSDIGAVENVRILGWFKAVALKLEAELKEAEQQTMTQTQIEGIAPVKWGE